MVCGPPLAAHLLLIQDLRYLRVQGSPAREINMQ